MKKYDIAIVTKDRKGRDLTLKYLGNFKKLNLMIFCGEDDVEYYKRYADKVFSQGNEGYSQAKNLILRYFIDNGIKHGVICDDDIRGVNKLFIKKDGKVGRESVDEEKFYLILDDMLERIKDNCLVNLSFSAFNNFLLQKVPIGYVINKKLVSVFVMHDVQKVNDNNLFYDESLQMYDAEDITIRVVQARLNSLSFFKYEVLSESGVEGGLFEEYKKKEIYRNRILTKWGELMKLTKSKNKTYEFNVQVNFKKLLVGDLQHYYKQ